MKDFVMVPVPASRYDEVIRLLANADREPDRCPARNRNTGVRCSREAGHPPAHGPGAGHKYAKP